MKKTIIAALSFLIIVNFIYTGVSTKKSTANRIQPGDLTYLGAFRLPGGAPGSEVKTWAWGGYAMTYYPGGDPSGPNDGYPGSIFGTGHAWQYQVSEITIPAPVISASKNLNQLNTAATLQSFQDIMNVGSLEIPRVGLEYLPKQGSQTTDKLYFCYGAHFQNSGDMTHGWCELNLANPQIKRAWYLDSPHHEYNTNDYLCAIPTDWAALYTPGKLLATGRFRDGGWSGQGPALYAIGPWNQGNPPPNGTSLQYVTLLRYTSTEDPESWNSSTNHTMTGYLHSDEWSGAAWLTAGDKSAVVFVGTKGTGDCWYGDSNGPCLECQGERGWWSTGFEGQFIFYDPEDLAAAASGAIESWSPQPYASLNVDQYLYHITSSQQKYHLGAAGFDPDHGYLYVFEPYVDEDKPLIHVWKVKSTSSTAGITVISPNGGENWSAGSSQTVTWSSTGTVGNVKIEYSTNSGSSWSTIISSTANDGSYSWTVPGVSSTQCLVRISETDGSPSDTSNSVFTITTGGTAAVISLNRDQLTFGAIASGNTPGAQTFSIENSGSGTMNWTVTSDASWLSCTPQTGANAGLVTVSVNPSGLVAGEYSGTITVSSVNASNSPQTIGVTLNVYAPGGSTGPFGVFSTPQEGSTVSSSIPVTGWVLDDVGVDSVKIYRLEGSTLVYIGEALLVEGARPDVEEAYPGYPLNYRAGWGYMMLTNFLPNQGNGTFTFYAIATDQEGHQVTLGTKTITCDNAHAVNPFGAIDTPAQGGTASGGNFINWGWALTPQPNMIPIDGSTLAVYVDGVNLGHPTYNIYRSDVAGLFPGYANSGGAAGSFSLDTTAYENGVHTILWTAVDDAGHADGIGSRYFTIQNAGSSGKLSAGNQGPGEPGSLLPDLDSPPYPNSSPLPDLRNLPTGGAEPLRRDSPIRFTKGFNANVSPQERVPDEKGWYTIEIKELERLVIYLEEKGTGFSDSGEYKIRPYNDFPGENTPAIRYKGYMVLGNLLKPLPVGSTLDPGRGIFYWTPAPGFIGDYHLVFLWKDQQGTIVKRFIRIRVYPKF